MDLSQIKGAGNLLTADFYPRIPTVDRESETANKTTIVVYKKDINLPLYYVDHTTQELELCEPINSGNVEYELNARDATNPFRVLVSYDYINHTIIVRQGTPAADPELPAMGTGEYFISAFTEQKQGDQQTIVEPTPITNYFRVKQLTKAAGTYSDIVDFSYSKVYLTITGAITISNPDIDLTGDFLPDGKTLMLCLRGSANTITWGSNFVMTDNSLPLELATTKWNKIIITKNELTGKYEWCNTDTVTV